MLTDDGMKCWNFSIYFICCIEVEITLCDLTLDIKIYYKTGFGSYAIGFYNVAVDWVVDTDS